MCRGLLKILPTLLASTKGLELTYNYHIGLGGKLNGLSLWTFFAWDPIITCGATGGSSACSKRATQLKIRRSPYIGTWYVFSNVLAQNVIVAMCFLMALSKYVLSIVFKCVIRARSPSPSMTPSLYCVGHIVWVTLCRSHCVGHTIWVTLCGSHCVVKSCLTSF